MVYIGRYFGPMGGFGCGPHGGLGPTNNTININLGSSYPYGGGMYNFNNWMPKPPRPRSRFNRFWNGFDRAMSSLAPIGMGVAGFFALFGKNGILKSDKTNTDGKAKETKTDKPKKTETPKEDKSVKND